MARKKFPVLWTLLLLFGIVWLVNEMGIVSIDLPWFPVVLIVVAVGMIANRYQK